ncbi:MAG: ribosome-binding factor A [Gammaproteobacteria bacterium]|jgi:ribosome-binding factor A
MAKEFSRSQRVGDQIQKELATIIQMPVRDAGKGLVTISAVDLSTDLSHAKIYVTCLGIDIDSTSDRTEILAMLNDNAPQFRHRLSKILTTRIVPKLKFMFDESLEQANRLTSLIDSLHTDDRKN